MNQTTLVVGAGPAGLAAAAELGRAGVPAVVLERAEAIGAAWRDRYDRLRLNTSRLTSKLPAARYRPGTSRFPTRDEFVRYMEDYASHHELDVRHGTRVDRLDRDPDGWLARSSAGELAAAHVIVATGYGLNRTTAEQADGSVGELVARHTRLRAPRSASHAAAGPPRSGRPSRTRCSLSRRRGS